MFRSDADTCASVLNGLHRILDLEVATIGREDGIGEIVTGSYGRLPSLAGTCWPLKETDHADRSLGDAVNAKAARIKAPEEIGRCV